MRRERYETQMNETAENKSALRVIVHSFFVIPFLIAAFGVLVFFLWQLLTYEPKTAEEYLTDVKIGGATKRWQAAFELARILTKPEKVPKSDRFVNEMITTFEWAKRYDPDPRVKRYLISAMGVTRDERFSPVIKSVLDDSNEDILSAVASALGLIGNLEDVGVLSELSRHESPSVRFEAAVALGNMKNEKTVESLKIGLNDTDSKVQWVSAISLANLSDDSGRNVLLLILDKNYMVKQEFVNNFQRSQMMIIAINSAAFLDDLLLNQSIQKLSEDNFDLKVRNAAIQYMKSLNN